MSYIGSTPTTQSFIAGTDSFNGTGSQTNFTLSRLVNSTNDIQVVVNNVVQYPPNYSVSGNTLTISPAPSAGTNNVYVRYLSTTLQSITVPGGSAVNGTFLVAQDTYLATTSGSVGIGTTSPDSLSTFKFIDVGSSATNQGVLQANNGTVKAAIYVNGTNGNVSTRTNHNLNIQTNGTTRATFDTSGNVGIGTSSPAASLSVTKQTTALSGTSNSFGVYLYPTSSGQCWLDALTSSTSNTSMGLRSYNNGTYYTANLDNSGNFQFNSGYGSTATAYGCRAWVNFNGTGTVAIRASGNVSSITDNGVGNYTINFTTAMPDANYSISSTWDQTLASGIFHSENIASAATSNFNILCSAINNGAATCDPTTLRYAVFR